ncbi:MAG: 3-dehydroquinate synthase, partial [Nitrospirota bacterium]
MKVSLAERSYDILIRAGLLGEVGRCLRGLGFSGKVAVVTNPTIRRLYAPAVIQSLKTAGYETRTIVIPDGERAKSLRWVSTILDELA